LGITNPPLLCFCWRVQTANPALLLHPPCAIPLVADNNGFWSEKVLLLSSINTSQKGSICQKQTLNTK